jgi:hypothetical protein
MLLLILAALAGDGPAIAVLRGRSARDGAREAPAIGYYEALIDVPRPPVGAPAPGPPAGWTAFGAAETGIVREVASYLRWTLKPGLDVRWYGQPFRTNRLGFRSPEIEVEKPAGTYRIVVFGSSCTMGYGIDDDSMYTRLLERWLDERAGPAHRVEVVNLAVSGDSPSRRLLRMQQEAGRLHPDWVLCDVSPFDPWLEDRHIHAALQHGLPIPFAFVREAVERSGATASDSFDAFREKFSGESERILDDVLAGWVAEAKRIGVPLTLVILPAPTARTGRPACCDISSPWPLANGSITWTSRAPSTPSMRPSSASPTGMPTPAPEVTGQSLRPCAMRYRGEYVSPALHRATDDGAATGAVLR